MEQEISFLKESINKKNKYIEYLKSKKKISKMIELDDKYRKTNQELQDVSKKLYNVQKIQNKYFQ